jgi:uncharacterized membrane protein YfcA
MPVYMDWNQIAGFALAIAASGATSGLLAGLFGIGGGAVIVPVLFQLFGVFGVDDSVSMHLAVGSSLLIIIPTAVRSLRAHKARGVVDTALLHSLRIAVPFGAVLAAIAASFISGEGLRLIFAIFALLFGIRLLFNRDSWRLGTKLPGNPWRAAIGIGIGFFSTLMGIGGGIMNSTFMTLYGRPLHQAVATSSGIGLLIAVPGAIGYLWAGWGNPALPVGSTGFVNWIAVGLVIPIALVVTPYGVGLAHRLSRRTLELGFGLFCLLVSARFFASLA